MRNALMESFLIKAGLHAKYAKKRAMKNGCIVYFSNIQGMNGLYGKSKFICKNACIIEFVFLCW